jgi:hypothetical protein
MPDASTALQIIGGALNAPAAPIAGLSIVPEAPIAGETPQQATLRAMAKASAPSAAAGSMSINDKLAILDQGKQGKFDYTPPPSSEFSAAHTTGNVGAGFNEALAGTVGAPVDIAAKLLKLGAYGPHDVPSALDQPIGGSDWIKKNLLPNPDAYPANNAVERVARGTGAGIASMVLPYGAARTVGAMGAAPTSALGRGLMQMGEGSLAGNAVVGAGAGAGGQIASENVPDEYKPLASLGGQMLGGGAVALGTAGARAAYDAGASLAGRFAKPMLTRLPGMGQGITEDLAGQRLANAASDVSAVKGALEEGAANPQVPGSQPTLAQATGDQGLLGLERAQATRNPAPFLARRADQNAAQVAALENSAPAGATSTAVGDYVTRLRDAEDANTHGIVQQAQQGAASKVGNLGGNLNRDDYGAILRDELSSAKTSAKAQESKLWQAIDPNNSLVIDASPAAQAAKTITSSMPQLAKPMSGDEADIFQAAQGLSPAVPFAEFTALRSRLLDAIRNERFQNGDTPALRRLQMLRGAMDNTIAGAGQAADVSTASTAARSSSPAIAPQNAPSIGGTVFTPSGAQVGVRYEIVPGNSLIASHTQDLNENPAFPSELQPRQRGRAASEAQIASMAQNLQPERLGGSASAGEGAPIVGPDNVVESGNGRALAIVRAYQQAGKPAQAYRNYLASQGFNTEGIENPVLIRRRVTDLAPDERIRFAQESNASPGLAMSATERAAVDAGRLSPDVVDLFKGGDTASAENVPFVRAFARNVLDRGEEGSFVTPDGRLSVDGARRVDNALLSKAYGNADLVASLTETGDENIKAFGNALRDASGSVARLNSDIQAGRVPEQFSISGPLVEAAQLVQKARATRTPLANLVAQSDAFSRISPMAENVLRAAHGPDLDGRINRVKLARILGYYADEAGKVSTEAQLFASNVTPQSILEQGLRRNGSLFEQTAAPSVASGSNALAGQGNGASRQGTPRPELGTPGQGIAGAESGARANVLPQAQLSANFGPSNAAAYRAAANATRERARTFNAGSVGQALRQGRAGLPYSLSDSQVAGKFFNGGSHAAEDVQSFLKAVGDRPRAVETLQDYAAADLLRSASRADGTLEPAKLSRWMDRHADALRAFPELAAKFRDASSAESAVADAMAARKAALDAFDKGAAAKFIGSDPVVAVDSVLRSKDPAGAMRELVSRIGTNPDSKAGLQRAIIESIERKAVGNELAGQTETTFIKSDTFQNLIRKNDAALSEAFSPEQMDSLRAIAADLQRANLSKTGGKLPGGSNTAQDVLAAGRSAKAAGEGHSSNLLSYFIAETVEHLTGHPLLGVAAFIGKPLVAAFRNAGLGKVDDLVTQAMLDPELARALLAKMTEKNAPMRTAALSAQLKRLSVAAPAEAFAFQSEPKRRALQ